MANIEYWMSPALIESYDFITQFKATLNSFGPAATFQPRYKYKNLQGKMGADFLRKNCYGDGRFCATENESFEPQSVLMEGVRQICIWNLSKNRIPSTQFWWNYIFHYRNCLRNKMQAKVPDKKHCYDTIKEELDISPDFDRQINDCINSSFTQPEDKARSANHILESNENSSEYSDVYLVPAVFVNKALVKEDLKTKVVTSAICNTLNPKPEICNSFALSGVNWNYHSKIANDTKIFTFLSVFAFIVVAAGFALWWIKRTMNIRIHNEITSDIRSHVTEYMKLKEHK